ncbi:hypothetical protein ACW7G5_06400, partial [Luteimonas sp. A501]
MLLMLLCGLLLAPPAVSQSGIDGYERLSEEELNAAVKRLQENFKNDVQKARNGECTPGVSRGGNPTDRYCKTIYDADFVIQAIDTPSPTPDVWRRLNELSSQFPEKTA